MKSHYSPEEQHEIIRWCEQAIRLYREYINKHGADEETAEAKAMLEIVDGVAVDMRPISQPPL